MLKRFAITACYVMALTGYSALAANPIGSQAESDIINNQGKTIGKAVYVQGSEGVVITINVTGLPAGKHGMHFHQKGTCADHKTFKKAKGHIMPTGRPHGYLSAEGGPHEGNLPNLVVGPDGSAHVELYSELIALNGGDKPGLLDDDGSALIIHANEDDHRSQPIGGSGARIACGVITASP